MAEVAATLQQAEPTRVLDAEVADRQVFRVVQRTPDPLAIAGVNRQAAGIVELATVVEDLGRLVGAEQEHRGQRRNAQLADLVTQEHLGFDVHHGVGARTQDQAISASGAWRIQQRKDHQVLVTRLWTLDPELGETREFFARRQRGVDRHATGRQAVHLILAHDAEIAGAEHGHDFVLLVGLVDREKHTETGVTQLFGGFRIKFHVAEIETRRVVLDFMHAVGGDFVDFHRGVEMHPLVIEGQLERGVLIGPLGFFIAETNLLVVSEFHFAEFVRQIAARSFVFLPSQLFCLGRHIIQTERPQLTRAEQAKQGRARHQCVS